METLFNKYFHEPTKQMVLRELKRRPIFRIRNGIRGKNNRSPEKFAEAFISKCKKTARYKELSLYFEFIQKYGLLSVKFSPTYFSGKRYLHIQGSAEDCKESFLIKEVKTKHLKAALDGAAQVTTRWTKGDVPVDFFLPSNKILKNANSISLDYSINTNVYIPLSKKENNKLLFPLNSKLFENRSLTIIPLSDEDNPHRWARDFIDDCFLTLMPTFTSNGVPKLPKDRSVERIYAIDKKGVFIRGADESYELMRKFFRSPIYSPFSLLRTEPNESLENTLFIDDVPYKFGEKNLFRYYAEPRSEDYLVSESGVNLEGRLETDNGYRYEGQILYRSEFSEGSFFPFFSRGEDDKFQKERRKTPSGKNILPCES